MPPNVCIAYYSRTGNTRSVAETIAERFPAATIDRIRPEIERSYVDWLLRSAVPG